LIEAKSATCQASVRYSGDHKLIREFMEERLIEGTDRPVGVSQLITAIEKITSKPKDELPDWLRDVRKIIPVIITKDDIGSSWMTNAYLNAMFQQKRTRHQKRVKITPLVTLNIGTLERACSAMGKMPFSDIMEDRIQEDNELVRPFEAASSYVARGTPKNMHEHVEIMKKLGEEMRVEFGLLDETAEQKAGDDE
jgi:hypothetical protein